MLLCAVIVAPLPAGAQTGAERSGIEITPARFEFDLDVKGFSVTVAVTNYEPEARTLDIGIAGLGHDLDGAPQFIEPAVEADLIKLSATHLVLAPGQRRDITLEGAIPFDQAAIYGAMVVAITPPEEAAGPVQARTRVASLFFLRGPRPWKESVKVVDVGGQPAEPGEPIPLFASVRNTGDVHVRPTGKIKIRQDGVLLDTVELESQLIIPAYARRLTGLWEPPEGITGRVELEAVIKNPDARGFGFLDLDNGAVLAPDATISNLRAADGDPVMVEMTLTNTGSVPIVPEMTLTAANGERIGATTTFELQSLNAGESRLVQWEPALSEGEYLVTAQVRHEGRLLNEAAAGLSIGGLGLLAVEALAVLLLSITLGLLFLVLSARRVRPEEQAPSAPELEADGPATRLHEGTPITPKRERGRPGVRRPTGSPRAGGPERSLETPKSAPGGESDAA